MSILDRLEEADYSSVRRPYPWGQPVSFKVSDIDTGKIRDNRYSTQHEYAQQFVARVTYWANDAERPIVRRSAHQALVRTVYGDILAKLHHLRLAVYMGSRDEAVAMLEDITRAVEGS